jgi:hypothetical protein
LDKAHTLLEFVYLQSRTRKTYQFLNAAVKLDSYFPPNAIRFAIDHYPEQLKLVDEQDGCLPIIPFAIAAELRSLRAAEVIKLLCEAFHQASWAFNESGLAISPTSGKE